VSVCLLQLNQQSLSESEFKEDDNETEHRSAALPANSVAKKKKKRKKKVKSHGNHISSEDNECPHKYIESADPLYGKLYDALPKQLEKNPGQQLTSRKLLTVELKHLNQQN